MGVSSSSCDPPARQPQPTRGPPAPWVAPNAGPPHKKAARGTARGTPAQGARMQAPPPAAAAAPPGQLAAAGSAQAKGRVRAPSTRGGAQRTFARGFVLQRRRASAGRAARAPVQPSSPRTCNSGGPVRRRRQPCRFLLTWFCSRLNLLALRITTDQRCSPAYAPQLCPEERVC